MTVDYSCFILIKITADNEHDEQALNSGQRWRVAYVIKLSPRLGVKSLSEVVTRYSEDLLDLGGEELSRITSVI